MATRWIVITVQQLRMFAEGFKRQPPRRQVRVSDYTPPAPALPERVRLPRPEEPVLKQVRVEDDRTVDELLAERNQLVEAVREKRLANVQHPGNVELAAEVKAMEERARWLEDQARRKKAAQAWKLAS